ncbi:MAG: hypothetical protein PHQ54_03665, partial [Candidatus Omnitrophica bacterium]|nr:hypothetical protein [Candidatus Omnitrophota bacterium]
MNKYNRNMNMRIARHVLMVLMLLLFLTWQYFYAQIPAFDLECPPAGSVETATTIKITGAPYDPDTYYVDMFQIKNSVFIDVLIDDRYQLPYDHITTGFPASRYVNPSSAGLWLVYLINIFMGD